MSLGPTGSPEGHHAPTHHRRVSDLLVAVSSKDDTPSIVRGMRQGNFRGVVAPATNPDLLHRYFEDAAREGHATMQPDLIEFARSEIHRSASKILGSPRFIRVF